MLSMILKASKKAIKSKIWISFAALLIPSETPGFKDTFVFQEYIEGSDDSMFVYTAYVNSHHKVTAMTGGRILMHDRTPELIGNYNAITNACDTALCEKLKYFLEHIDFTGTCHFDVQYDAKRQGYVVFEMNIRQGRSNYYTAASGVNLAKLIVEDYLYHKETPVFHCKTFVYGQCRAEADAEACTEVKRGKVL